MNIEHQCKWKRNIISQGQLNSEKKVKHFNLAISQLTRTRFKQQWFTQQSFPIQIELNADQLQKKQYKPLIRVNFMNYNRSNSKSECTNKYNQQHLPTTDRANFNCKKVERIKNEFNCNERQSTCQKNRIQFDVDDLASSLASPIKLESKIGNYIQTNKLNASRYQYYLKDIQKEKDRYHQGSSFETRQQTKTEGKYPEMNVKQNVTCKRQSISKYIQRRHFLEKQEMMNKNHLLPWRQNEEQLSHFKVRRFKVRDMF